MKERFEGPNRSRLITALSQQPFVSNTALAEQLARQGTLLDIAKGQDIITQNSVDTDVYLIIMGVAAIIVNGAQINTRKAGEHVGEMAAINPALPRSATVRALDPCVVLKVRGDAFMEIGRSSPEIWLPIATELSRRLYERNSTILVPNDAPKLFLISSSEAIAVAHAIRDDLQKDIFIKVWDQDVFFAGGYPLEALEAQLTEADFAVAVGAADDMIDSRGTKSKAIRDNVVFELGLFMGKLTRYRAVLVHPEVAELKLPSDLHGLTIIPYEDGPSSTVAIRVEPVCQKLRELIVKAGVRTFTFETDR